MRARLRAVRRGRPITVPLCRHELRNALRAFRAHGIRLEQTLAPDHRAKNYGGKLRRCCLARDDAADILRIMVAAHRRRRCARGAQYGELAAREWQAAGHRPKEIRQARSADKSAAADHHVCAGNASFVQPVVSVPPCRLCETVELLGHMGFPIARRPCLATSIASSLRMRW